MAGKRNRGRRSGASGSSSQAAPDSVVTHSVLVPTPEDIVGNTRNQGADVQSIDDFIGGGDSPAVSSDWVQAGGRRRRRERAVPQPAPAAPVAAAEAAPRRQRRPRRPRQAQMTQERRLPSPPPPFTDRQDSPAPWNEPPENDELAFEWDRPAHHPEEDHWGVVQDDEWHRNGPGYFDGSYAEHAPWDQSPQYEEFYDPHNWRNVERSYSPQWDAAPPHADPWLSPPVEQHSAIYNAFTGEWTFPHPESAASGSGETRSRRRRYRRRAAARQQQLQQEMELRLQEQAAWAAPDGVFDDWGVADDMERMHVHTPPSYAAHQEGVRYFVDGWPVTFASHTASAEEEEEEEKDEDEKEERLKKAREVDYQPDTLAMKYSRACGVCLTPNPLVRVALTECGHMVCAPCVEQLEKVARGVTCPFCRRSPTSYVRLFETV